MNIHEENNKKKIGDLSKLKEDLIHNYKSRTPVPKNSSKLKAKRPTQKKLNLKSSSPKKDLIKLHKRNSNDFQEISAEHIKRMKNKGSKSVELFNHNQESKRNPLLKMLNHSNMPRSKSKKQEKHGKVVRVKKNNEKLKKKSSSPSDIKSKEHKNLDELINIQNLFKNCVLKRKKKTSMRKKPRTVLKEFKNIQENLNEKSVSHDKNKANLCIDVQNEEEVENSEYIGKNDSWFIRNESKLSDSLEIFSDINPDNIIDESEVIPKNFSFINTENLKLENKVLERKHSQSFDHGNNRIEFIQYETEYNISQKSEKIDSIKRSQLSISSQNSLKICPSTHPNRINKENFSYHYSSLQIFKQEKPVQSIQSQSNIHIPKSKPILLQVNNYPNSTHITSKASLSKSSQISIKASQSNHQALLSQLTEELSCNINNLFLIEQLKNFELVNYSIIESYTSTQITTKMKQFINHKFMTIINFLQPDLEYRISQFLSLLDSDETSEFLKMSQKKKEAVKKLLLDIQAADLPNFDKVIDSNVQNESNGPDLQLGNDFESFSNSSKESSTDEELQALGMQKFSTIQQGDEGIRGLDLMTNPGSGLGLKIGEDDKQLAQGGGNSEPSFLRLSLKLVACEQAEKNSFDNLGLMKYVDRVLLSIKSDELIKQISVPLSKDALKELDKIQDLQIGTYTDLEIRNFSHLFNYESALKLDIFPNSNELQDKQTELQETSFKLMALDNLNYFLQQFRPFSYKGKPLPWQRRKKFEGKVDLIDQVVEKVKLDFEFHSAFHLGKYEESLSESNDKLMRAHVTEKQINQILEIEIPLEEEKWTDYEFEETQVKIDLADVVLYELVTDLATSSPKRKLVPKASLLEIPSPSPSNFQNILNSTPTNIKNLTNKSPSLFTFENVNQDEVSQILLSNKRGFAKVWNVKAEIACLKSQNCDKARAEGFRGELNKEESKTVANAIDCLDEDGLRTAEKQEGLHLQSLAGIKPVAKGNLVGLAQGVKIRCRVKSGDDLNRGVFDRDLNVGKMISASSNDKSSKDSRHSLKLKHFEGKLTSKSHKHNISFKTDRESHDLRSFISGLVEKKLGFKTKLTPSVLQYKKPKKRSEASCSDIKNIEDSELLSTGYLKYHNDISSKLKVSKILVNQHKQTRKQTQIFFPALKRVKNPEDNSELYIN